jgi:hypothetical protein
MQLRGEDAGRDALLDGGEDVGVNGVGDGERSIGW